MGSFVGPLSTLVTFLIAVATATALTWFGASGDIGFATTRLGAWTAAPKVGTLGIDPYSRASYARLGALPTVLADGLEFTARRDSAGKALNGGCTIRITGTIPQSRFWTITVIDGDGALIANPSGRTGFTSTELIRNGDGTVEIIAAPRARAGNWLPTAPGKVALVLRLYDTQIGVASRTTDAPLLPTIAQEKCP